MPIAAGSASDAQVPAAVALLDMAAECRGAAGPKRGHNPTPTVGEDGSMVGAISAEDVRHLPRGPHQEASSAWRCHRDAQTMQARQSSMRRVQADGYFRFGNLS
jgi:hypothetical protein